jgi:alpha-D-xyloside xylohydrolase
VLRRFTRLKAQLMPYIDRHAVAAARDGLPVLRPMVAEFPDDPACTHLDRQYMFGDRLLVAPVFSASGEASYYIPAGTWTHLQTGATYEALHGSARCATSSRCPFLYALELSFQSVPGPTGAVAAAFEVVRHGGTLTANRLEGTAPWRLLVMGQPEIRVPAETDQCSIELGSIEL